MEASVEILWLKADLLHLKGKMLYFSLKQPAVRSDRYVFNFELLELGGKVKGGNRRKPYVFLILGLSLGPHPYLIL